MRRKTESYEQMRFTELMKAPIADLSTLRRLELVLNRLNISKDDSVLDIGLGTGFETYILANRSKEIVGIDISDPLIKYLKKHLHLDNVKYYVMDAAKEPPNEYFDAFDKCICIDVFEHVEDPKAFLNFITKILKRSGWLGMTFPIRPTHGRNYFRQEDVYSLLEDSNLNADIKFVKQTKFGILVSKLYSKVRSILKQTGKKADIFHEELAFEMLQHPEKIDWLYKLGIVLLFKLSANTFYDDETGGRALVIAQKV